MRAAGTVGVRLAGAQILHPRAAALGFTREPVGVKRAEVRAAVAISDLVELDRLVPDLGCLRRLLDLEAEDLGNQVEHTADDAVDREVGAQLLVVEVVLLFAPLLAPVRDLPRLERTVLAARLRRLVVLELGRLAVEEGLGARVEVADELERGRAGLGHTAFEHLVGEVRLAEDLGLLLAQREDLPDERRIVVVSAATDTAGAFPDLPANVVIVDVLEHRDVRRCLQGEAPHRRVVGTEPLRLRVLPRRGLRRRRQAGELRLVVDHELPIVGRVEDVLPRTFGPSARAPTRPPSAVPCGLPEDLRRCCGSPRASPPGSVSARR